MKTELLDDGWEWLRIAGRDWDDPLDPGYAQRRGGRWNPAGSFPVLYLNEDLRTSRVNLRVFVDQWPYEPEDLRNDTGPVLVTARLPRRQSVADVHSPPGLTAAGLPRTYPLDRTGVPIPHDVCQPIGSAVKQAGLRGILCRSANAIHGAGRELAWFPATPRSKAREVAQAAFTDWFWGPGVA